MQTFGCRVLNGIAEGIEAFIIATTSVFWNKLRYFCLLLTHFLLTWCII